MLEFYGDLVKRRKIVEEASYALVGSSGLSECERSKLVRVIVQAEDKERASYVLTYAHGVLSAHDRERLRTIARL